jgi:DNA-binding MarR family transcriptional regulator
MEATEATPAGQSGNHLLFRLLRTAHALTERLDRALHRTGLSLAALDLLTELVNATEPLHARDLATGATADAPAVGALLDGLELHGLVRRVPRRSPAQGVRIVITARGRALQRAGVEQIGTVRQALARAIADVDVIAVERALAALR